MDDECNIEQSLDVLHVCSFIYGEELQWVFCADGAGEIRDDYRVLRLLF